MNHQCTPTPHQHIYHCTVCDSLWGRADCAEGCSGWELLAEGGLDVATVNSINHREAQCIL